MARRTLQYCSLFVLLVSLLLPAMGTTSAAHASSRSTLAAFPTVDPNYIYQQLAFLATHFQRREAGYDDHLPVTINGHDEFADAWTREIMHDLEGFGPGVGHDAFHIAGWKGRPAVVPAVNVEVSVPGIVHPEQVVVIGCHYDGEASSTQSANDDASGCAIELGVAQALGVYWRQHHVYPARTLRFVMYDAEEQGIYGSFHYINQTINGDLSNVVAMFNEEQSGIAYPVRYLGQLSASPMPFYIELSPLQNNQFYPHQNTLSAQQRQRIALFRDLMQQAIAPTFSQLRALGFQQLSYHGPTNIDVLQPIFTPADQKYIHAEDDNGVGSDQIPFTFAGVPCATFVGDSNYYAPNPPPGSYPYDQPQDTIQLMDTFASGGAQQSMALTLALGLPGMLTTWMLDQPSLVGHATFDGQPVATISDVGQTLVGKPLALLAQAAAASKSGAQSFTWEFGDGTGASGEAVQHTYQKAGQYTLALVVHSSYGTRRISKPITVTSQPALHPNPFDRIRPGTPPANPHVVLPTPNPNLMDRVVPGPVQGVSSTPIRNEKPSTGVPPGLLFGAGALAVALGGIALLVLGRRRRKLTA